jgi:glycerol kinase
LAGLALGVWRDTKQFLGGRTFARFEPNTNARERQMRVAGWRRAVSAALTWAREH